MAMRAARSPRLVAWWAGLPYCRHASDDCMAPRAGRASISSSVRMTAEALMERGAHDQLVGAAHLQNCLCLLPGLQRWLLSRRMAAWRRMGHAGPKWAALLELGVALGALGPSDPSATKFVAWPVAPKSRSADLEHQGAYSITQQPRSESTHNGVTPRSPGVRCSAAEAERSPPPPPSQFGTSGTRVAWSPPDQLLDCSPV